MVKHVKPALFAALLLGLHLCPPSFAATATMKLVEELEEGWSKSEMLDSSCKMGAEFNADVLSFFNPFIGTMRVKAFSKNKDLMSPYMTDEEMKDEDTVAAFADAMEAALLRAMRKRCPDVW